MRPPGRCLASHESATARSGPATSRLPRAHVDRLTPTWGGTNLGQALVDAVAAIEDVADTSEKTARMPRRIVLVSDLAQGSRLDALGDFEWPSDVELDLKTVADTGSNAGLERLADQTEAEPAESADTSRRVRVVNNPGSGREKFELIWVDEKGVASGKADRRVRSPGRKPRRARAAPAGELAAPVASAEGRHARVR